MDRVYVYSWRLRPRRGLEVEVRIEAPSAIVARREVALFLEDHKGLGWALGGVRRSFPAQPDPSEEAGVTYIGGRRRTRS